MPLYTVHSCLARKCAGMPCQHRVLSRRSSAKALRAVTCVGVRREHSTRQGLHVFDTLDTHESPA